MTFHSHAKTNDGGAVAAGSGDCCLHNSLSPSAAVGRQAGFGVWEERCWHSPGTMMEA